MAGFLGQADGMKFREKREVIFLSKKPGVCGSRAKHASHAKAWR
jgi:hypothetical protein